MKGIIPSCNSSIRVKIEIHLNLNSRFLFYYNNYRPKIIQHKYNYNIFNMPAATHGNYNLLYPNISKNNIKNIILDE